MEVIPNPELEIKAYDRQVFQDKNSPLPSEEATFLCCVVGSKGSGKSNWLVNQLLRKEFYKKKFDRVILCIATLKSDSKWSKINLDDLAGTMHGADWDEEKFQEFHEETCAKVEHAKAKKEDPPLTLVIIDDYASILDKSETLKQWVLNSRHCKTSFFVTSQKYTYLPMYMRTNADCYAIFPAHSLNEKQRVIDEVLSPYLSKREIEDLLKIIWQHPRDFLWVNNRHPRDRMFYKQFSRIVLNGQSV